MLPSVDTAFLEGRFGGGNFTITADAGYTCVVVPGFSLPEGYNSSQADLLLRLQNGYPDCQPDMWWFSPAVLKTDNTVIPNTDTTEQHLGRGWQRWSRHLPPGAWRPGIDGLESFFALLCKDLGKWVGI
jgi:Prokaryotic E2 family E